MGINFPSSPADKQLFKAATGIHYQFFNGQWQRTPSQTALPKNYMVNPAMQVSQQNADVIFNPGVGLANAGYYPADQWLLYHSAIPAVQIATLGFISTGNNVNRMIEFYTNNGPVTTAAAEYAQVRQYLEGQRVSDFQWGTADAKDLVLRFDGLFSTGGQYTLCIGIPSHYYLLPFSGTGGYAAYSFAIPGITAGTFNTDNTYGLFINLNGHAGSDFLGVGGGWQAAPHKYSLPGSVSFIRGTGSTFAISNVGLYLDPYKTGVAPPWEAPDMAQEIRRCQRYFQKVYASRGVISSATSSVRSGCVLSPPMRATPAISLVNAPWVFDVSTSQQLSATGSQSCNPSSYEGTLIAPASSWVVARPACQFNNADDSRYIAASARM